MLQCGSRFYVTGPTSFVGRSSVRPVPTTLDMMWSHLQLEAGPEWTSSGHLRGGSIATMAIRDMLQCGSRFYVTGPTSFVGRSSVRPVPTTLDMMWSHLQLEAGPEWTSSGHLRGGSIATMAIRDMLQCGSRFYVTGPTSFVGRSSVRPVPTTLDMMWSHLQLEAGPEWTSSGHLRGGSIATMAIRDMLQCGSRFYVTGPTSFVGRSSVRPVPTTLDMMWSHLQLEAGPEWTSSGHLRGGSIATMAIRDMLQCGSRFYVTGPTSFVGRSSVRPVPTTLDMMWSHLQLEAGPEWTSSGHLRGGSIATMAIRDMLQCGSRFYVTGPTSFVGRSSVRPVPTTLDMMWSHLQLEAGPEWTSSGHLRGGSIATMAIRDMLQCGSRFYVTGPTSFVGRSSVRPVPTTLDMMWSHLQLEAGPEWTSSGHLRGGSIATMAIRDMLQCGLRFYVTGPTSFVGRSSVRPVPTMLDMMWSHLQLEAGPDWTSSGHLRRGSIATMAIRDMLQCGSRFYVTGPTSFVGRSSVRPVPTTLDMMWSHLQLEAGPEWTSSGHLWYEVVASPPWP